MLWLTMFFERCSMIEHNIRRMCVGTIFFFHDENYDDTTCQMGRRNKERLVKVL